MTIEAALFSRFAPSYWTAVTYPWWEGLRDPEPKFLNSGIQDFSTNFLGSRKNFQLIEPCMQHGMCNYV